MGYIINKRTELEPNGSALPDVQLQESYDSSHFNHLTGLYKSHLLGLIGLVPNNHFCEVLPLLLLRIFLISTSGMFLSSYKITNYSRNGSDFSKTEEIKIPSSECRNSCF